MDLSMIQNLVSQYGVLILLGITFLEALNCPGLPAGVILPAAGFLAAHGELSIIQAILMTIVGGVVGGMVLYLVGRVGGAPLMRWLEKRSAHFCKASQRCEKFLEKGSFRTVFVARILPVVRTILPLPAGAFRVSLCSFLTASVMGIACYNIVCVGAGYFFGNVLL